MVDGNVAVAQASTSDFATQTLEMLGANFIAVLPQLIKAIILILLAWIIGWILKKIIVKAIDSTNLDRWLEEQNLATTISGHGIGVVLGTIMQWVIIALALAQSAELFEFRLIKDVLAGIAEFIMYALAAGVIMIAGLLIARYLRNALEATTYRYRKLMGVGVEVIVIYVTIIMALETLRFVPVDVLKQILAAGLQVMVYGAAIAVAMLAFTISIAFGLALEEDAERFIKNIKKSS